MDATAANGYQNYAVDIGDETATATATRQASEVGLPHMARDKSHCHSDAAAGVGDRDNGQLSITAGNGDVSNDGLQRKQGRFSVKFTIGQSSSSSSIPSSPSFANNG